jgi:hypothetical protein
MAAISFQTPVTAVEIRTQEIFNGTAPKQSATAPVQDTFTASGAVATNPRNGAARAFGQNTQATLAAPQGSFPPETFAGAAQSSTSGANSSRANTTDAGLNGQVGEVDLLTTNNSNLDTGNSPPGNTNKAGNTSSSTVLSKANSGATAPLQGPPSSPSGTGGGTSAGTGAGSSATPGVDSLERGQRVNISV